MYLEFVNNIQREKMDCILITVIKNNNAFSYVS